MEKLAFAFKKLNSPIVYAAAACASGIAFIALPSELLDIVILALGALISLISVCALSAWAFAKDTGEVSPLARRGALLKSSLMLLFGISLMLVRSSVSRSVCTTLGILLVLYSLFRLCRPARTTLIRKASWYIEGIVLVFLILLGATVAIIPFWPKITAGVALLAFGLKLVCDMVPNAIKKRGNRAKRQTKSSPCDIYSTDFVDKSDNR